MKSKVIMGILLTLLLMGMLSLAFIVKPIEAEPGTWIVDDDGLADFGSIQDAINNANEGDTIHVKAGTYYENIVIDKEVSLIGKNKDTTIIDGGGTGRVVIVRASNVIISGFTIQNSGELEAGILLYSVWGVVSNNNSVYENKITRNRGGIYIFGGSNNKIYRNEIGSNGGPGIKGNNAKHNIFSGNNITDNEWGIELCNDSFNNTISGNTIRNHVHYGIVLLLTARLNIIHGNNITNNVIGIAMEQSPFNKFYHNNFIDNNFQLGGGETWNLWDNGYPSGGNYWSDYSGVDFKNGPYQNETGSDGIGDTPHTILVGGVYVQDNYPLMTPWTPRSGINELIRDIDSMNLQQGIDNSLDAKLTAALGALEALNADKRNDAINKLYALIIEVEAQRGKKLTNEQADYLVATTQEIIDLIG